MHSNRNPGPGWQGSCGQVVAWLYGCSWLCSEQASALDPHRQPQQAAQQRHPSVMYVYCMLTRFRGDLGVWSTWLQLQHFTRILSANTQSGLDQTPLLET